MAVRLGRALLVVAVVTASACSTPDTAEEVLATESPPATTTTAPPAPMLGGGPMTACSAAGVAAWCGRMPVPEDRDHPRGRIIELRVTVVPAAGPSTEPDPVFFLAGGPGGAATESWASAATLFPGIHADRDIVLVDQRGTGGSNRLQLPEPPDLAGLSAGEMRDTLTPWVAEVFGRLPGDYRHYTSSVAADDLDAVRRALGYETIDLYGGSYGATLAQYYLRQYPERVRTAVLDGGTLLDVPIFETYAGRSQEALESVFTRCRADDACRRAFPDPAGDLRRAMRRLSTQPVTSAAEGPGGTSIVIDGDTLAGQVHLLLLTHRSGEIPRLVHHAATGDLEPMEQLAAEDQGADPMRLAMFWSTVCSEAWARSQPAATRRHAADSYLAGVAIGNARSVQLGCSLLEPGEVGPDDAEPVRSEVPVLLLNGSEDPQDPPANVADASVELPNSRLVVAPGQGHTVGHLGCLPDVVAAFIEAGSVDGLDTTCVESLTPPPFVLDPG
jgi:pimeloyl-ACP methyl ester carboxylesterase